MQKSQRVRPTRNGYDDPVTGPHESMLCNCGTNAIKQIHSKKSWHLAHTAYAPFNPSASDNSRIKSSASVTKPSAWNVPRSANLVTTAGLMSTATILTEAGSMLPVAIE